MNLLIDIKNGKIDIVLKEKAKKINSLSFLDEHNLTEKLLISIDKLLRKNNLEICNIKNIWLKSDKKKSFTTQRIAQITADITNKMKKNNI